MRVIKPEVIISDFDRTLAYLYRDTTLLEDLTSKMVNFYQSYINIPLKYISNKFDGYHVWHDLHEEANKQLDKIKADIINEQAENIVTDFEIEVIKKVGLMEGIEKTINKLVEKKIRLGVVSNNAEKAIRYALQLYGIDTCFEYIGGRPYPFDPKLVKPNPYPILQAINEMNIIDKVIWYTGDDISDMQAARAAKVIAVGIYSGRHSKNELINAGAKLCFASFNDVIHYLEL